TGAPLGESLASLKAKLAPALAGRWSLRESRWIEVRCNWKLAARALGGLLSEARPACLTPDELDGSGFLIDAPGGSRICWILPNTILVVRPDLLIGIVLQPTSLRDCLLRLCLLGAADGAAELDAEPPAEAWSELVRRCAAQGESAQLEADRHGTPS